MSSAANTFSIIATGNWSVDAVRTKWTASHRRIIPQIECAIESAWNQASAQLGDKLFDGPMCRLESFAASPNTLDLVLSPTSYRLFLGTHLAHPEMAGAFGTAILANSIGLSALVESADGWLLLGRRNDSVAYHPDRVHPFAGSLEPGDNPPPDIFADIQRELREEINVEASDISDLRCIGMVRDNHIRQPELIFHARLNVGREIIEARLDRREHQGVYAIRKEAGAVAVAKRNTVLTPVAAGALALAFPNWHA